MKRFTISIGLFLLFIIFVGFYDIHFLRGFYFHRTPIQQWINSNSDKLHLDFTYSVTVNSDSSWDFNLRNNNFSYPFIKMYRNGKININFSDSTFLGYATRIKFSGNGKENNESYGSFFCSTGLESVFLRPYEKFTAKLNNIYDCFSESNFMILENEFSELDSVTIQFYLPVYSMGSDKSVWVYSNPIVLPYDRIYHASYKKHLERKNWIEQTSY